MDKTLVASVQPVPPAVLDLAQAALAGDLLTLVHRHDRSGDATMVVPGEYLEVVIARR